MGARVTEPFAVGGGGDDFWGTCCLDAFLRDKDVYADCGDKQDEDELFRPSVEDWTGVNSERESKDAEGEWDGRRGKANPENGDSGVSK
jgi:hypothetical protein